MRLALLALAATLPLAAQQTLTPIPAFPLDTNPLHLFASTNPLQPFSVTGERGAILGQQDGSFELWLLPTKVLGNLRLHAQVQGYDADIDLNQQSSTIDVRPDHTTITYAHAAITVRQHMFIPRSSQPGIANAVVLFEVHAVRPATITLSFTPSMERMWPAPNFGRPSGGWTPLGTGADAGGYYDLNTDNPRLFGLVAMPSASPGEIRPYQERPLTEPMTISFRYDPARGDDHRFFPLLAAISDAESPTATPPTRQQLLSQLLQAGNHIQQSYEETSRFFGRYFDTRLTAETPDPAFDRDLRWAELAITTATVASPHGSGLAGGWFTSGDSARPGFGWFFGRDTLWSLYAVNGFGDFTLARHALDFLFAHQRADGKMMHEVSQTADEVDWPHLPYLYASADSTPLAVMQMDDFVRRSGDVDYLRQHWDAIKRCYSFTRAHITAGVYDNSEGTGWVEEWFENGKPGLPHQEVYLVALDVQASQSMQRLAALMHDPALAAEAAKAEQTATALLSTFRDPTTGLLRFSRNADGTFEDIPSIFPAVAFWTGDVAVPDAQPTLSAWASTRFSTDWGERSVPPGAPTYDPISYHHGSVWPLYTGWASLAQFHTGHPLAGLAALEHNAELTTAQDLGDVTEVLSGAFFAPLGRSSSHQLWSSAMVLTPAIRGVFGVEPDALTHTLRLAPALPAAWDQATLHNLPLGELNGTPLLAELTYRRAGDHLEAEVTSPTATTLCLTSSLSDATQRAALSAAPCNAAPATHHHLSLSLPALELGLDEPAPMPGAEPRQLKVLNETRTARSYTLQLEAPAGSAHTLLLRRNGSAATRALKVTGATLSPDGTHVTLTAPAGSGWQATTLELRW